MRSVVTAFAAASSFLAVVQVLCLGLSVAGLRVGPVAATFVVVASVACAVGFAAWIGPGAKEDDGPVAAPPDGLPGWGGAAVATGVLAWAAWVWVDLLKLAWQRPPLYWDSLVYHIPAIHDWVQHGRVGFVRGVPDVPFVNYPMGVEVTAFVVHQVSGTSRLVDASNLWFWPLGITALAVIAAEFGARGTWRWLPGALLVAAPTFVAQGATAYVDAGFATTVMGSLAAACLFVSPATSGGPWTGILLGLNVGLMLGTKGSGLPFATVVIAAVVAVSAVARRRHPAGRVRISWPPLLAAVVVALAVGGYWYVRNALVTGNPLYPFRLQFGPRVLAQGFDPQFLAGGTVEALAGYARWSWRFVAWLQPDAPIRGPYSAGGLGYIWLAGALPAIGYWWVRVIRDRARRPAWALGLVTGVVGVLYVIQPAAWEARYTLWLLALGLPCLGAAIGDAAARWRSRPGHLAVLAIGLALAVVAVWESHRTLTLEWSAHRSSRSPGGGGAFRAPADVYFPGLADASGFKDFLASRTVARGRWSRRQHAGTFLGGVLAMPLGARQVLAVPALSQADLASPLGTASGRQEPSPEGIAQAQAAGATWFLWESDAPGDTPAALVPFTERYSYRVADDVSFELFCIGRASATPAPDGQDPTTP